MKSKIEKKTIVEIDVYGWCTCCENEYVEVKANEEYTSPDGELYLDFTCKTCTENISEYSKTLTELGEVLESGKMIDAKIFNEILEKYNNEAWEVEAGS